MVLFSDSWVFDLLLLSMSISLLFYWFAKQKHTYWERKGFYSHPHPNFLFGHFGPAFAQKMHIGELMARIYKNVDEPYVGIYGLVWPILLVCDPDAVRNILIRDFDYFADRIYRTLRKYPIAAILNRICVNDYKIPGTDKVIEKGTQVLIPALALQMDEKYYDEPKVFKPERFVAESSVESIYLPFGEGPRYCPGMRMGKIQVKVAIVLLLLNYKYELASKRDMEFDPKLFFIGPKDPVKLRIIKRQKCGHETV